MFGIEARGGGFRGGFGLPQLQLLLVERAPL
jgi:hypothetical protein